MERMKKFEGEIMITATEKQRRIEVGERLRNLRKKKGLKQADMARKLSVSPTSYMLYEQGKQEPSIKNLINIADILGISIDKLLDYEPNLDYEPDNLFEAKTFWELMGYSVVEMKNDLPTKVEGEFAVALVFQDGKEEITFTKRGSITFINPKAKVLVFENKHSFIQITKKIKRKIRDEFEKIFQEKSKAICSDMVTELWKKSISLKAELNENIS